ncbi:nucleotidyltransferase family protein [Roseospira marina]|uniref:Nucleotidyltransferase family protein n=1 Tax=Roseospira marina TaxID=140057 RepID=A0A5M6ICZ7_9PROT|nr:nucleotidyltransferase family protein [Roseospira marina]KAA5605639.1 nucleotidyltransferase family protein [Roseospira marina]MBB4313286.1 molybdenum cofactor cytidylyltransferase [Roseospira marina]MBB5085973.1 molybdenum cofactor cytidylyltransferase [Roseospira marina]
MSDAVEQREPRIGLVLLAAGMGRRMAGPNKLLLDLGGMPVVRRAALPLCVALPHTAPRIVVTGRDPEAVTAALAGLGFTSAHNPCPNDGMGASLAVGVTALPPDLDAILVALGDMPGLCPETVDTLIAAFSGDSDPAHTICRPFLDGQPGHPVLWGADHRPALAALTGDRGGRDLIQAQTARVRALIVDDPAVIRDIDRPADLEAVRNGIAGA